MSASSNPSSASDELGSGEGAHLLLLPGTFMGIFLVKGAFLGGVGVFIGSAAAALSSVFCIVLDGDGAAEAGWESNAGTWLFGGGTRDDTIGAVEVFPVNLGTVNGLTGLAEVPVDLTAKGLRFPSFACN
jgi:hypothetical protein